MPFHAPSRHDAEALAGRLPPLLVAAERVAATVAQGVHGRRRVGGGDSFWQFRPYAPGDSASRIDWRETAKSQRAYIRETEWEAAQSVWLWRDESASMAYASRRDLTTKGERAALILLALACLLIRGGERVALLGAGLAPGLGRGVLERMALLLARPDGAGTGVPEIQPLPRHGGVVLIGDFLGPVDTLRRAIGAYATHGARGHLLQVLDPAEESLPFDGRVRFEGLEREAPILISRVGAIRARYVERLLAHRAEIRQLARAYGWSFAVHHTDQPPHRALLALYALISADAPPASVG
jgi:uncharacterized protein (DUF58 family)